MELTPAIALGSAMWLGILVLVRTVRRRRGATSSPRERLMLGIVVALLVVVGVALWLAIAAMVQRLAITRG